MGVTIHYRGTIDDPRRIEEMEDHMVDLTFSLGGRATVWRSYSDKVSSRIVRGLLIEMAPGQETFSLLLSPEGHLTPLSQIEDAEQGAFDEPPFCSVKTQFGSVLGHIAIVHVLDALSQSFFSQLEIIDEGQYYENRSVRELTEKVQFLRTAIDSLAEGLKQHALSQEAAEDPSILAVRIERVAQLVHQKLCGDSSATANTRQSIGIDSDWHEPTLDEEVAIMESLRRQGDLRSERMSRRISEATAAGISIDEALKLAMRAEGFETSGTNRDQFDGDEAEFDEHTPAAFERNEIEPNEPWRTSLLTHEFDDDNEIGRHNKHAAVEQAEQFLLAVMKLGDDERKLDSYGSVACRGAMDIVGGLVQATFDNFDTRLDRALAITQLKRALTGHAFARGALFAMRSTDRLNADTFDQLHQQLELILLSIHDWLSKAWDETSFL